MASDTADVAAAARVAAVAHSTDSGCPAVVARSAAVPRADFVAVAA